MKTYRSSCFGGVVSIDPSVVVAVSFNGESTTTIHLLGGQTLMVADDEAEKAYEQLSKYLNLRCSISAR